MSFFFLPLLGIARWNKTYLHAYIITPEEVYTYVDRTRITPEEVYTYI